MSQSVLEGFAQASVSPDIQMKFDGEDEALLASETPLTHSINVGQMPLPLTFD